jgi:uncharacterized lipoprotein YddW (UPF0748 family)
MQPYRLSSSAVFSFVVFLSASAVFAAPAIPATPRETRGAWCATVSRIDWPPQSGVSSSIVAAQKARLIAHLDALADANMNAMYLQVRPAGDAFYASSIEPWSQWLTGSQNTAATYDPLAFAVTEGHKRGIEIHAWVNPYRVALDQTTTNKATNHVMRARPDLCVKYSDGKTYLDPGKTDSIDWIKDVVADIVGNYDVDGVVFDDYFYPGTTFGDSATYKAYKQSGGTMTLDNWRRENVNKLIQQCSSMIHGIRPTCQFGVGPFGIWRPGYPSGVTGADYYATHYCDSRKWLQQGWVDSLSPQLYWTLGSPGQPFGDLIDWWVAQNPARHVLASTAVYRVGDSAFSGWGGTTASEIVNQVNRTATAGGVGNVHYSVKWLTDDPKGVRAALKAGPYASDAVRPAATWLDSTAPAVPNSAIGAASGSPLKRTITFSQNPGDEQAAWWCVNTYDGSAWKLTVLPGTATSFAAPGNTTDYAVSAVDRAGNESAKSTGGSGTPTTPPDIILDTGAVSASGDWATGTSAVDKYGSDYRFRLTEAVSDAATWTWTAPQSRNYEIYAWWSQGSNRSATAPFVVSRAGGTDTVYRNQQTGGGAWQSLGVFSISAGTNTVRLSCWTTAGYVVIADAIKIVAR